MGPDRPAPPRTADPVFAKVFGQCAASVRRTLRRLRIPDSDLPDLEQETWFAIWMALGRQGGVLLSDPESFSRTIAYRRGIDRLKERRRSPEQPASLDDPEPMDPSPTSEEQVMHSQEERQGRALVLRLLDDLPMGERAVVVLADFESCCSMGEIAEELGISEEAARSRHRRAHERMRQSLERRKQMETPVLACALLPAVAALSLNELLSVEAPAPPLSAEEHARVWARVMSAIGGKALAFGGGAMATMLTAKHAAAGALIAFVLGGAADRALLAASAPVPVAVAAEAAPALAITSTPPAEVKAAEPSPSVVVVSVPTAPPVVVASDLGPEWQAIRDARALLRGKQPAPEAALEALKRVRAPQLRELREQLRAEAETMKRTRSGTEAKLTP